MKNTCSKLFFVLILSACITANSTGSPTPISTKITLSDKFALYGNALAGLLISIFEGHIIKKDDQSHTLEQRLLARGQYKRGFFLCVSRRLVALALSNALREYTSNTIFKLADEDDPGIFLISRISYAFTSFVRLVYAIDRQDSRELITGVIDYWRKWNNSVAQQGI